MSHPVLRLSYPLVSAAIYCTNPKHPLPAGKDFLGVSLPPLSQGQRLQPLSLVADKALSPSNTQW